MSDLKIVVLKAKTHHHCSGHADRIGESFRKSGQSNFRIVVNYRHTMMRGHMLTDYSRRKIFSVSRCPHQLARNSASMAWES